MEGSDGGRASWSYREQTGMSSSYTISRSSAGTVSTGFTSTASRLSGTSMEAARHLEEVEKEDPDDFVQPAKKLCTEMKMSSEERPSKMEQKKSLVEEFFDAPPAKSSIGGGDMSVLARWFTELGVGWILHLPPVADGAPEAKLEHTLDASRWMLALTKMVDTLRLWKSPYSCHGSVGKEPAIDIEFEKIKDDQFQFASFTLQAMLKMLGFIDVIVAPNHNVICGSSTYMVEPSYENLHMLLRVRDTLSQALSKILLSSYQPPSAQVGRIHGEMIRALSEKEGKAGEAIWSAMEEIRNRIVESVNDSSSTQTRQVSSSDIHEATESLMKYVMFLQHNFMSVDPIVSEAASHDKYVPQIGGVPPLRSLVLEMMSCVQEKLANMSEKFPDQSLRFLFLINNLSFIGDKLQRTPYFPESYKESLAGEVEAYMQSYMQVSWAPVLSCLFNPTPLRVGKTYSPLPKFESKFRKTYTTQKLWTVPDPKLRKTLREAITEEIVPGYTKYIEDNSVATPKFTPQNLQEMLQELFEG